MPDSTCWVGRIEFGSPVTVLAFREPEDQAARQAAMDGARWQGVVQDLDGYLRNLLKYDDPPEATRAVLQMVRDKLHALVIEDNLEL